MVCSICASACSSLQSINRSPSFWELICSSLRDRVGYQCCSVDHRDLQKIMVQRTWDTLEKLTFDLSRLCHHLSHTLSILDNHARTAGRVIIDDLADALESTGHNIHDFLDPSHDFSKEQHQVVALYLMRDVRSMGAELQSDINDLNGSFQAMHLLETSSKDLPARDVMLALLARCNAIIRQFTGQ